MIKPVRFAHLPTPVEPMQRLTKALGGPELWIKRDDQTGLALGGNKTRKLEYALGDALAHGAQTLVTVGAIQSNHVRQTAAVAARFGLSCIAVLSGGQPEAPEGNMLLDLLMGAEVVLTERSRRDETLQAVFDRAQSEGRKPYLIPVGASNGVGALGYVDALDELAGQLQPDWIVFCSSSGGTQAGLALGAKRRAWPGKILGVSNDSPAEALRFRVVQIANEAAALQEMPDRLTPEDVDVCGSFLGVGYGVMIEEDHEAIRLFARLEGLLLDPVYTGRGAAGLIGLVRKGFFHSDEQVLFWHTGGTPALFAEPYAGQVASRL